MQFSRASWILAVAYIGAIFGITTASVVEVDLVFPRNDTYAPTSMMPFVFAFQNAELAQYLSPSITYEVWNVNSFRYLGTGGRFNTLKWANWSSHEPYFVFRYDSWNDFMTEGSWELRWDVYWAGCDEQWEAGWAENIGNRRSRRFQNYNSSIIFSIKNGAREVDLVAATANETCPTDLGVAINLSDKISEVPDWVDLSDEESETCAVVASATPTATPDPCRVKVDSDISESMYASWVKAKCNTNPALRPAFCPPEGENAARGLAVGGVMGFVAAFAAFGFILA